MKYPMRYLIFLSLLLLMSACKKETPVMLGTIEWDRITLPATASEPIADINVVEGAQLAKNQIVMQLDPAHAKARLEALQFDVAQAEQALKLLQVGARPENRREANARLASLTAQAKNADAQLARIRSLVKQQLLPRADLDRAVATANSAQAEVRAAKASSDLLENGSRTEDVAQAQARLNSAQVQRDSAMIDLNRLTVRTPRVAHVDSLPYKLGDQPAAGAPLAVLLVGDAPIARVYVPEPMRAQVKIGDSVNVVVVGSDKSYSGKIRMVRSEPSFTPYYALNGKDAARLSYLAEISLGADAANLPAGVPVRATLGDVSSQ
ncbi:MAG: HlyD family efflux transporter periplasmic adaptor subunit [Arenimonas sp.]